VGPFEEPTWDIFLESNFGWVQIASSVVVWEATKVASSMEKVVEVSYSTLLCAVST